jgi:alkanesulfonate monooxygenase SsuD/methylene tetrahydromethanopterin reductase-like flavin-dependent oxidoreductase (luciferase family)
VNVGVGLPSIVPGAGADLVIEWARRADGGPFSSLGVVDRLAFGNYEPMTTLAAAAAVTERVRLVTMAVIAPLRNAALLAKAAATVDRISGGRLVLGLTTGAREDDYLVAGVDGRGRGRRFSEQLVALRAAWEEDLIGPAPARMEGPTILVGGASGPAFARMARHADGYVHGGGPPRAFAGAAARALAAWAEAERPGRPALWGQAYFALGEEEAVERGADYLRRYYAFTGPFADKIAAANLTTPQGIIDLVRGYEDAGCDELVLLPTLAQPDQLERLADVLS